jgi:hypothetical protein
MGVTSNFAGERRLGPRDRRGHQHCGNEDAHAAPWRATRRRTPNFGAVPRSSLRGGGRAQNPTSSPVDDVAVTKRSIAAMSDPVIIIRLDSIESFQLDSDHVLRIQ